MAAESSNMQSTTSRESDETKRSRRNDEATTVVEPDDGESPKRKKRRVIQESDKKYLCPHDGCTKAYSRAEHLHRHQLNHAPKQIYRCDYPGCDRNFVRADLCTRHKERHVLRGPHLQRKDISRDVHNTTNPTSPVRSVSGAPNNTIALSPRSAHAIQPPTELDRSSTSGNLQPAPVQIGSSSYPAYSYSAGGHGQAPFNSQPSIARSFSYHNGPGQLHTPRTGFHATQPLIINTMQPPHLPISSPGSSGRAYISPPSASPSMASFQPPISYSPLPITSPFGFALDQGASAFPRPIPTSDPVINITEQQPMPNSRPNSLGDLNAIDQMEYGYSIPVFGQEGFNRSPSGLLDENLLQSLFSANSADTSTSSPGSGQSFNSRHQNSLPNADSMEEENHRSLPDMSRDGALGPGVLDINIRESNIGEQKHHKLVSLVGRWNPVDDEIGRRTKEDILKGKSKSPGHVLSLTMLKTYLTSYWVHIHCQMPILHRPTFHPDGCPELLMLTMMCLGATCLERTHNRELMADCAELAFFMAYHIRWEVFKDSEFRAPAKLWTFQTMLLLELFEKMYSTRYLHERSHIHHATTLAVMRRGSSLIGRNTTESSHLDNPPQNPSGPGWSINASGRNTPDVYWNRWITGEATRRAAFAAFIIDSTHATLFGHSAVMSPHDLRLPLPCDEAQWSATSSAEVQRMEGHSTSRGIRPITFLDGLKRTLNGQKVRTNNFGRVILMSGLLNVSYHMNQRDLQVSSLGAAETLGNRIKWRSSLIRAFDFWRRDFDDNLSKKEHSTQLCNHASGNNGTKRDHVFESRTCLHSLAHMAMHVDITDCLVFAGSKHVLGRMVTESDRCNMQRRMREQWAPSARARDATFYALRFLCEVLIPEEELVSKNPGQSPTFTYSARDDDLLNRPWALYFALLIVWSYGYALEGPITPSTHTLSTRELRIHDMQHYLIRMGGVASPDDLENLKDRNSCLGLLLLLRESFQQPRWELLRDADEVLGSCINLLMPHHPNLNAKLTSISSRPTLGGAS